MRKIITVLIAAMLINSAFMANPALGGNIIKILKKDTPTDKAILILKLIVSNSRNDISQCELVCNRKSTAYSCLVYLDNNAKRDKLLKTYSLETNLYLEVEPGELDINLIDITTKEVNYRTYSRFQISGKFNLKPCSVNYLGDIHVDIAQSVCSVSKDENTFTTVSEKFKSDFSTIYNAVNGQINWITFTESTPVETGEIIFSDNFEKANNDWHFTNDNIHKATISDGAALIDNQGNDSCVFYRNVELPKNFDSRIEFKWVNGESNKGFGVIIGSNPQCCFKFSITANGYFSIYRWLSEKEQKWTRQDVVNWTKTQKLNTKSGETNSIRIQKTEWFQHTFGVIAFYINDSLVARNVYSLLPQAALQFEKQGIIGFYSYGKQAITLDNFTMNLLAK